MFGDPVTNSMNWEKKRFDSLCENLDGRRRPITSTDRIAGPYPYYGASGIVDHVADYIFDEDILLISEDGANLLARSTPIAFSVRGKVWVNNHAHVLRFSDLALQKYIEYFFAMISIEDYITGSTQPKLNQAKLNAMLIPVPSKERMDAYHSFIEQVDKSKVVVQAALDKAQTLFDSLMQQYFG
ncbi:MAG: restriction endonuclease subunit S [Clostridia bacterium]|nr:restriction endonuclease subunit S [Clostridia bacterium]